MKHKRKEISVEKIYRRAWNVRYKAIKIKSQKEIEHEKGKK